ncbi:MAG: hypothetical protein P8K68_00255 [Algibacter sp.]|uniref:hypothetical protein n=1 Tax=Algibacter sp. TaxID=1872428 RepID=UPI002635BD4D|nr:hypothetical protein [Algibacter sp.]MDG1728967.1 hypothetical protein [Algibacter sp.]MDG2177205.1 hypothetical protein [Algibacter sp.]
MKKVLELINSLTPAQKAELEKDMQQLYITCFDKTKGQIEKLKDVTVNMRLQDEVFLKVTFEFDRAIGEQGTGRITALSKYQNKLAYEAAVAAEQNLN